MSNAKQSISRVRQRLRSLRLVRWLAGEKDILWVSIIKPNHNSLLVGMPNIGDYRGLLAITEIKNEDNCIEWHFLWGTESSAERHEERIANEYGAKSLTRVEIRAVEIPKEKWWKRTLPWGVATGALASLAALTANIEELNEFGMQLFHEPVIIVEHYDTIRVADDAKEHAKISVLGDPFIRARLADLSMTIVPDPDFLNPSNTFRQDKIPIPASHRSIDRSKTMTLVLPFEGIPHGRYLVHMTGKTHTAWNSVDFTPDVPLKLDVRKPVSIGKVNVMPWPQDPNTEKYLYALVDISLRFGRPVNESSNVWIIVSGKWVGWDLLEGTESSNFNFKRTSMNTPDKPKSVSFTLLNVPSNDFSEINIRVRIDAPSPLTRDEWDKAITKLHAEIEN